MSLIAFLIIGAIAGWLAGKFIKGSGSGLFINMLIGIVGAILGGFVFGLLGIAFNGLMGSIVTATIGAMMFLFIMQKIK